MTTNVGRIYARMTCGHCGKTFVRSHKCKKAPIEIVSVSSTIQRELQLHVIKGGALVNDPRDQPTFHVEEP